ncbi:MAG TPA: PIG-L family deacetylase [Anaerolineae bacterium]|nr:PIG-L family deacetylase [Anaerolineae bacterium]
MLGISFTKDKDSKLRVLCLGAHSDDIEIGCGGTILRLAAEYPNLHVHWVVFGANQPQRAAEAHASAQAFLNQVSAKEIVVKGFRDSFFPYIGAEIKEYFEDIKQAMSPDLIFCHTRHDFHQDHRLICELTWNTFRNHFILEYEIPKYDGDIGSPNFFVQLDESTCLRKIDYLFEYFKTQASRDWFTKDTFLGVLRLRGIESKAPNHYAEAFYTRKVVF